MIDFNIGGTRIVFGLNSRWEKRVPHLTRFGDERVLWTQRGACLAVGHAGFWGTRVRIVRIPYTRKVWAGAHKAVTA